MNEIKGTGGVNKTQRHRNHWAQWTIAELTFVEQHYGQFSVAEIGEKLGGSVSAVRAVVGKLELGKWHNVPWTEMELALMRVHYKKGIDGMTLLLSERTRGAIVAQAGKMGLTEARLWQPDEDRVLREVYPEGGVPGVRERLPHRTIPAIKHRVTFLKLRSAKRKNN